MGEIKSTLDLVMEKTRHMNLTQTERHEKRAEEMRKALRGLIQKFRDHVLRKEQFLEAFGRLEDVEDHPKDRMLLKEVLEALRLDDTPESGREVLELLEFGCGLKVQGLSSIFRAFDTATEKARSEGTQEQIERLFKDHQISGSAVTPNLEADPAFTEILNRLQKTYEERLETEKARLMGALPEAYPARSVKSSVWKK
ncbi:MAG: hypothetical protein U5R49_17440 [Deltaproteobacteria bacterium]|nr:hypothetical protein [Deltaproteobacteria bacterium]